MAHLETDLYSEVVTLKKAVKDEGFQFPIIVRICENIADYEIIDPNQDPGLPIGCLLMLESQVNICYAHVRVLDLEDRESVLRTKGWQYVSDYDALVSEDFLIPHNLPYRLKISPRPNLSGKKNRYVTVSEVIENLPRFVQVGSGTMCYVPEKRETKPVPAGTRLEVKKVIEENNKTMLVCIDDKSKHFMFKLDSLVNLTAKDEEHYTLDKITPSNMLLPKIVRFIDNIPPNDVVVYNDDMASKALLMTFGTMEILGIKRRPVLVGFLREKDYTSGVVTYKQVLIPIALWENEMVEVRQFHSSEEKYHFCKRKFSICTDEVPYEEKLYYIPYESQKTYISYLVTSPSLDSYSDGDSSDDYEKPIQTRAPAIPPRVKVKAHAASTVESSTSKETYEEGCILLPTKKADVNAAVWTRIIERTKLGFGHVHKELAHVFSVKEKRNKTTNKQMRYKTSKELHVLSHTMTEISGPEVGTQQQTYCKPKPEKVKPLHKETERTEENQYLARQQRSKADSDSQYYYTQGAKDSGIQTQVLGPTAQTSTKYREPYPIPPSPHRPLPEIPTEPDDQFEYDYPNVKDLTKQLKKPKPIYKQLTVAEVQTVTKKNQTVKDFCKYSVNQVYECLKMCGLEDMGQNCLDHTIDGAFLASYDFEMLRKAPFELNDFQLNKVKRIIQEGWRPKFDDT